MWVSEIRGHSSQHLVVFWPRSEELKSKTFQADTQQKVQELWWKWIFLPGCDNYRYHHYKTNEYSTPKPGPWAPMWAGSRNYQDVCVFPHARLVRINLLNHASHTEGSPQVSCGLQTVIHTINHAVVGCVRAGFAGVSASVSGKNRFCQTGDTMATTAYCLD